MPDCSENRKHYPKGLVQPENGFRFSVDSLLLSCFAVPGNKARILDLGTGCGVIPIGLFLHNQEKNIHLCGLESNPEMLEAVRTNIQNLGFEDVFRVIDGDVREKALLEPESFDLVVSNPPFREKGRGRECVDKGKQCARFEEKASLEDFVRTAAYAAKGRGRVCFVFLAERVLELVEFFRKYRLEPKRIRFCHGRSGDPSKIVLVEAVKNGKNGLVVESPLILYRDDDMSSSPNPHSLEFCPFLGKKGSNV
jgi:tRNA1Val (adenine37-N6)-methyltransferase